MPKSLPRGGPNGPIAKMVSWPIGPEGAASHIAKVPSTRFPGTQTPTGSPMLVFQWARFRAIGPKILPPLHRFIRRVTAGKFVPGAALVLFSTGARTGLVRETPLESFNKDGSWFLVGSNFAQHHHPAWTTNLLVNPHCEVLIRGRRSRATATLLSGTDRQAAWESAIEHFGGWSNYPSLTDPFAMGDQQALPFANRRICFELKNEPCLEIRLTHRLTFANTASECLGSRERTSKRGQVSSGRFRRRLNGAANRANCRVGSSCEKWLVPA